MAQRASHQCINQHLSWLTRTNEEQRLDAQFLATISQVHSQLCKSSEVCSTKQFNSCPFISKRDKLLEVGTSARTFSTILHKAVSYSMLDKHPLDSGTLHEEYEEVYNIDLTSYHDLETSLTDGRFEKLYKVVLQKIMQLAGL